MAYSGSSSFVSAAEISAWGSNKYSVFRVVGGSGRDWVDGGDNLRRLTGGGAVDGVEPFLELGRSDLRGTVAGGMALWYFGEDSLCAVSGIGVLGSGDEPACDDGLGEKKVDIDCCLFKPFEDASLLLGAIRR